MLDAKLINNKVKRRVVKRFEYGAVAKLNNS